MDNGCVAELAGVSKRYGATVALDGLDLEVRRGELLALLGPNGAGKTTAISLLLGLAAPDTGRVGLFGRPPREIAARRQVGVMMQEVELAPELRVRELVELTGSCYPAPLAPEEALAATRTKALAERPYGKLSGGQKRQAQFALAICGRPRLLFLDEPTVGLDPEARAGLWAVARRLVAEGAAIVLTTHYLEEAEALADRVVVLARGRTVAAGSVAEIRGLVLRKQVACETALAADEVRSWPEVESVVGEGNAGGGGGEGGQGQGGQASGVGERGGQGEAGERGAAGRLRITTRQAEAVVRRLLAADPGLRELEVRRAGLAEAFAELTREEEPS